MLFLKIIIAGAGDIGMELALRLSQENHEVVILEKDREKISEIANKIDAMVVEDTGEHITALLNAGVKDADVFISVTNSDELNMMFCLIAKNLSDIKTVARVRNPEYSNSKNVFSNRHLGIDIMIDPERMTAFEIAKLIRTPEATEVEYFAEGKIELFALRVEKDSELTGTLVSQLPRSPDYLIISILREDGKAIIPRGDDVIYPNDIIYVIKKASAFIEIGSMARNEKKRFKSVMILGGGKVGSNLAKILESNRKNGLSVKIVENSAQRCELLSDQLSRTLVLNGDAADINFLQQEDIQHIDVVVSVTGRDELNILTSLLAKKLGVSKTITEINRVDYESILQTLEIDSYVSSRLLVAGKLSKLFRKSNIISETILKDGKAEMVELIVPPNARFINQPLKELRLSAKGLIVGGILRAGKAIIPRGDDYLAPNDRLIIFTTSQNVQLLDKFFGDKTA